jgi:hypothetical protein
MRLLSLLFFLSIFFTANAQPGIRIIKKNINDYTYGEIKGIKGSKNPYGKQYYYILDKTTDLSKLKNLRTLHKISLIANVAALPKELDCLSDSLTQIDIQAGFVLTDISSLRRLKNLKAINLRYEGESSLKLDKLDKLESLSIRFGNLNNIEGIAGCGYIKELYLDELNEGKLNFKMLSKMNVEKLTISHSDKLKNIDGINKWKSLKEIDLELLSAIKKINFNELAQLDLRSLHIWTLKNLENVDSISQCKSLKELYIHYSLDSMKSLNFDLGKMNLEKLAIGSIKNLEDISDISNSKSLKELNVYDLYSLKSIDFDMSKMNFENARIEECQSLKTMNGIENCQSLKTLYLYQLNSIETLDFSKNKNLETLTIYALGRLKNIIGLDSCKSLKEIYIINSDQLTEIADLRKLSFVKNITLSANKKLIIPENHKKINSKWVITQPSH